MKIFNNDAYISAAVARDYATQMNLTRSKHVLPSQLNAAFDSPYFGSGNKVLAMEEKMNVGDVTGAGTFRKAMLQALDKVSGAQHHASALQVEAFINPDSVDIHDVSLAQAQAEMALGVTRNVLSRLVQSWRDLINTR